MKLIIDIPEDVRIAISQMGLLRIPDEMQKNVDKAIQHGTPLEQIRTEIDELETYYDNDYFSGNRDAMFKCNDVRQIIDKYRKDGD